MADNSALLKNGNKILIENEPYLVIENDFVNPGKGQAFTRVKIRNLLNKKILEKTIKIGESIQEADVLNTKMQFLYKDNETYFFMNLETYEQTEVISDILDENSKWLIDGDECDITIWNNKIIQVDPPKFVNVTIKSTIDAIKGEINVNLPNDEILKRKKEWKPRKTKHNSGSIWKYAQTVGPAHEGAVTQPGAHCETHIYADI